MTIKENKILDDPYSGERRSIAPPGYAIGSKRKRKEKIIEVDEIIEELRDLGLNNVHILKIEERR